MKQLKYITTLVVAFSFQQNILAAGTEQDNSTAALVKDTAVKKDSSGTDPKPVNDPKDGFNNILKTALAGDGVTGARLNPMAVSFVENYIAKHKKSYLNIKEKKEPHLNLMDQVLMQHGIPKEMKYLAVIESHLKSTITSWAGAVGPWQFMPATARNYGLTVSRSRDERTDYFKSTHAAARMLTELYSQFNDWLLVVAAYNGGPGNVQKAIRKSGGSKDFWTLQYYLPNESMNHVKKFIATHYIFEGEGGATTITRDETKDLLSNAAKLNEEEMKKSTAYNITGRFSAAVIIKYVDIEKAEFDRYNPNFDNEIALNGKYNLRLPVQKMNIFIAKRYEILDESMKLLMGSSGNPQ
ncbi:MAG: lytic transglycosylase domain-containing protein [Bacteroidota bacterium]